MPKLAEIDLPFSVPVSKKRNFYLNLNQYTSMGHFGLATAKEQFYKQVAPKVQGLEGMSEVNITYVIYPGNSRLFDLANVSSVVDKFFCDVLTREGVIEDDNYTIVVGTACQFGGIDRDNPRIVARISYEPTERTKPMRIIYEQADLTALILEKAREQFSIPESQNIEVKYSAGRGNDFTAEIVTTSAEDTPATTKAAPKRATRRAGVPDALKSEFSEPKVDTVADNAVEIVSPAKTATEAPAEVITPAETVEDLPSPDATPEATVAEETAVVAEDTAAPSTSSVTTGSIFANLMK